jgi:hypothetical protein
MPCKTSEDDLGRQSRKEVRRRMKECNSWPVGCRARPWRSSAGCLGFLARRTTRSSIATRRAALSPLSRPRPRGASAILRYAGLIVQPNRAGFLLHPALSQVSPYGQSTPPRHPATLHSCVLNGCVSRLEMLGDMVRGSSMWFKVVRCGSRVVRCCSRQSDVVRGKFDVVRGSSMWFEADS